MDICSSKVGGSSACWLTARTCNTKISSDEADMRSTAPGDGGGGSGGGGAESAAAARGGEKNDEETKVECIRVICEIVVWQEASACSQPTQV